MQECENLGKICIRVDLTGKDADDFLALKEKRGLKNNSELIRQLIKEASKGAK
ncbi:MAG: hypothetical protein QW146_03765 [Candidatus Bathyarchaeia archaeon]